MFSLPLLLTLCVGALSKDVKIDLSSLDKHSIGVPSEKTGEIVAQWKPDDKFNPEEAGEYTEGDILFVAGKTRNGLAPESTRWPNPIVPFEIDGDFDAFEMKMIEDAMEEYHMNTCIRFMPRNGREKDYLKIIDSKTGCWSSVGRVGGAQEINLQRPACLKRKGTVIHELMHAIGFLHEQNRENRDDYVNVMWNNIKKNHEHNFNKAQKSTTKDFGVTYDYGSVLHYSERAFSTNGERTIVPKQKYDNEIGQRVGFSVNDIRKINKMYNCK